MVYNWDGKQEEVYQLYVVERKSLDELVKHMKDKYQFEPSKRAYQTQFKRWNFPSKLTPAHKDAELVARVKQLWEGNSGQKDMMRILTGEGWDINDSDLMRLRSRNGWLLRGSAGYQAKPDKLGPRKRKESQVESDDGAGEDDQTRPSNTVPSTGDGDDRVNSALAGMLEEYEAGAGTPDGTSALLEFRARIMEPDPELRKQHEQRALELKEESDKLWASKKRRRRTQGFAGLPADPPQPPRYPSETTLDESKAFLHLDNAQYQNVREHFTQICESEGVIKKTVAGPEKWQYVKDRLATENTNINREFYGPYNGVPHQSKTIALDVICLDVTKRMRTIGIRMTLAEAKNALGLNPLASRAARSEFYDVLREGHFLSKAETGDERWQELKHKWVGESSIIAKVLNAKDENGEPPSEEVLAKRHKALDVLCRDVMKRLRDDITRADPTLKRAGGSGPGPGPAQAKFTAPAAKPLTAASWRQKQNTSAMKRVANIRRAPIKPAQNQQQHDAHIDPSLVPATETAVSQALVSSPISGPSPAELQAFAASASTPHQQHRQQRPHQQQQYDDAPATNIPQSYQDSPVQQQHQQSTPQHRRQQPPPMAPPNTQEQPEIDPNLPSRSRPLAALFRLHSSSNPSLQPKTWLGTLSSTNVADLIQAAGAPHGAAPNSTRAKKSYPLVALKRIEGMISSGGMNASGEGDVPFPIERDDELAAYCGYVGTTGMGKAVFVVMLGAKG